LLARAAAPASDVDVTADDGVRHQLWVIGDRATIDAATRIVDALPALYIADGHHRAAAAARVAQARNKTAADIRHPDVQTQRPPQDDATESAPASHRYFLSVLFPHHEMTILDYNRIVKDLNGRSPEQLLTALRAEFSVTETEQAVRPRAPNEFGLFVAGRWYRLTLPVEKVPRHDPIGRLPITLLTRHMIEPLFGIVDQRNDKRIDFVGGGRGLQDLERRVSSGEMAAAFSLYPTQMADLIAVADAGLIMPPKSTWFEPKLADGMVSHVLD
jgi:uncharacterized protein (DUF1015 family)